MAEVMAKAASHLYAHTGPKLGVVVVEPVNVTRAGLSLLIRSQEDMEVLAEPATAGEALQATRSLRRRARVVVLIGLGLAGEHDAFWLIRAIREHCPSSAIIGSGANPSRIAVSRALFVGADGFIDQNSDPGEFLDGLRAAERGEVVLTGLPDDYLGSLADSIEVQVDAGRSLTDREKEVLAVAAEGLTAREIGDRLGMRERTVTTHLGHIYWKLGVTGRVEALTTAARAGLVTVGWV
jgi:DNA-binding NarL/FixJ family response regulator